MARRMSFIVISICTLAVLPAQGSMEDQAEKEKMIAEELEREWVAVVLPFISDERDILRASPIVQTLPDVIEESLKFLRLRYLEDGEHSGYRMYLDELFGVGEIAAENVPQKRRLRVEKKDIASSIRKQLYFSELRSYLQRDEAFSPELISRLQEETGADIFIAGNVRVEDQYVFVEFLLISPYVRAAGAAGREGVLPLTYDLFSLRSIEALNEVRRLTAQNMGQNIYNAPAGSLLVSSREGAADEDVRVYIDGEYRGTAPLFAAPLAVGAHTMSLYTGRELFLSTEVDILENTTLNFDIPPRDATSSPFAFNTFPSGSKVYEGSTFLGYTPLLLERPEERGYLQLTGENIRQSYVKIDPDTADHLSVVLPEKGIDLQSRLVLDREQFYFGLGFTIVAAVVPLLMNGMSEDIIGSDISGLNNTQLQELNSNFAIIRSLTLVGWGVVIISLVNTLEELFDYLASAEASRSIIRP